MLQGLKKVVLIRTGSTITVAQSAQANDIWTPVNHYVQSPVATFSLFKNKNDLIVLSLTHRFS